MFKVVLTQKQTEFYVYFGPLLAPLEGLSVLELPGVNPGDQPQESGGDSKAI